MGCDNEKSLLLRVVLHSFRSFRIWALPALPFSFPADDRLTRLLRSCVKLQYQGEKRILDRAEIYAE